MVSEIQVTPIKPNNGLVAFVSFVLDNKLYLGSIGIMTRPEGGYRLVYPTKKVAERNINLFYPLNKMFAKEIEQAVISIYEEVMSNSNVRYSSFSNG
jgi:stage V sporulation protein G